MRWPIITRDTVIWLMGVGLTLHEFLVETRPRSEALVFCGLLLGLPGVLRAHEYVRKAVDKDESQ